MTFFVVNVHMFEKQNFLLRHGSATFLLTSTKNQFYYIIFSGSKTHWLMNKYCLLRFSISFPMVSFLSSLIIARKCQCVFFLIFFSKLPQF